MRDFDLDGIRDIIDASINNPTGDAFLDYRYEAHNTKFGHHWPYYRVFYYLAKLLQPSLVVELGGWQGTAAAHFAAGYDKATVVSIDHHTDFGDEVNKTMMEVAANKYPNMIYLQGWTTNELAHSQKGKHSLGDAPSAWPMVATLVKREVKPIDILFVDSWHRYDQAMDDWNAYRSLLASPSLVICDDIQAGGDEYSPIQGMLDFWNELPEPKFLESRIHPGSQMGFLKYDSSLL